MTAHHRHVAGDDDREPLGLYYHHRACDIDSVPADLLQDAAMPSRKARRQGTTMRGHRVKRRTALLSLLAAAATPGAMAQGCISLSGSTQCPAFSSASISTNSSLFGFFPFLQFVSDTASFDEQLSSYLSTSYIVEKYQNILGCKNINVKDAENLYARYTTTVICNSIIQNSKQDCQLSDKDSLPACADTCVQFAESESLIKADSTLCSNPGSDADDQIRADFTNCALPADSLTGSCIAGATNEPDNCGYGNSTIGFCQYCGSTGQNNTDTCCYNSDADNRCAGVKLPTITSFMTTFTAIPSATSTPSPSSSGIAKGSKKGLSGGAIAGIVVGSIVFVVLAAGLIFLLLLCLRRRRGSQNGSIFNQPSPARRTTKQDMTVNPAAAAATTPAGYEVLPGGRIARMSALEGHSGDSPPRSNLPSSAAAGAAAGFAGGRRRRHDNSSSSEYGDSPISTSRGILRPPPAGRRQGSLSSNSALGVEDPQSPISGSGDGLSSPPAMTSQQSEQLAFFKDYYSQDDIHPGDKVSTLWAYQPRAGDEWALERGDMLKVVGIWDDGWATGVLTKDRAEDWEAKRDAHRDSGVSHTSGIRDDSPARSGEIKAFPLVCVCLPDHWRKTIEGDGSTETASTQAGQSTAHA